MDRRSFLKIGAVTASSGVLGSCGQISQKIVPYVIPPDDGVNPVDGYWYATTCRECRAGCGAHVRTVNGRAKKIEGNPDHPASKGAACARGQAAVGRVYHPERLSEPLMLTGTKGSGQYETITWDKAISLLAEKLGAANGSLFFLNDGTNDHMAGIANSLFKENKRFVIASNHEPGVESHIESGALFSEYPYLPYPDMENAEFSLLLGADLFESDRNPVYYGRAFGESRRGRASFRGRMVYVGSRLSLTAASCDKWIPAPPGKLGIIACSIAYSALEEVIERDLAQSIPRNTIGKWNTALAEYKPEKVEKSVGIKADVLRRLAKPFVEEAPAVAIAGDDVAGYGNGVSSLGIVEFLNMLSYEIGREKMRIKPRHTPETDPDLKDRMLGMFGLDPKDQTFDRLKGLVKSMKAEEMNVGLICHTNPVYDTPAGLKFRDALRRVPFTAVFTNFMDETANEADLILPDHHWLESWSAQVPNFVPGVPVLNLQQPVIKPFHNTRAAADVLLSAAGSAGMEIPADSGEEYIRGIVGKFRAEMLEIPPNLDKNGAWQFLLRQGGWWPSENDLELLEKPDNQRLWALKDKLKVEEPEFDGSDEFPLHLHLYQTVHMGRGAGANQSWLHESPDPITTMMWHSWIELNWQMAEEMGIEEGDFITVTSPYGSVTGPAFPYNGLRPDVIAIPLGYGHTNYGKHADGRGANPMELLGTKMDKDSGALAWRSQKVKISKAKGKFTMLRRANHDGEHKGEIFQL